MDTGKWVCPAKANENFINTSPLGIELRVTIAESFKDVQRASFTGLSDSYNGIEERYTGMK